MHDIRVENKLWSWSIDTILVIAFHLPFAGNDEEAAKRRRLAYEVMT